MFHSQTMYSYVQGTHQSRTEDSLFSCFGTFVSYVFDGLQSQSEFRKEISKEVAFGFDFSYGNFITNVVVFEPMLDIVKQFEMWILTMLERNFFRLRMIKWLNYGIRKLVCRFLMEPFIRECVGLFQVKWRVNFPCAKSPTVSHSIPANINNTYSFVACRIRRFFV